MNEEESVKDKEKWQSAWYDVSHTKVKNQFIDINFSTCWASTQLLCPWGKHYQADSIYSFIHPLIHSFNKMVIWAPTTYRTRVTLTPSVGPQWVRQTKAKWPITGLQGKAVTGLHGVLRIGYRGLLKWVYHEGGSGKEPHESNIWFLWRLKAQKQAVSGSGSLLLAPIALLPGYPRLMLPGMWTACNNSGAEISGGVPQLETVYQVISLLAVLPVEPHPC